jgi:hypothetical protein
MGIIQKIHIINYQKDIKNNSMARMLQSMKKMGPDPDQDPSDSVYLKKRVSQLGLAPGRVVKNMKGEEVGRTFSGTGPMAGRTVSVSKDSDDATETVGGKKRVVKLKDLATEYTEMLSSYSKSMNAKGLEDAKKIAGDTTKYMSDSAIARMAANMKKQK